MRIIFFLFLLTLFACGGVMDSKTIATLKENKQTRMTLTLSPSTLRMLNVERDTAYDKLVKGVEKLSILIMNPTEFTTASFYQTSEKLMNEEGYEEYLTWEGDGYQINILGQAELDKIVGLGNYFDRHYILDLTGTVDLTQLPALFEAMSKQDSTSQSGFSYILDMVLKDEQRRQQQEDWKKEAAEREKQADKTQEEE